MESSLRNTPAGLTPLIVLLLHAETASHVRTHMKIVEENVSLVCNNEVLAVLQQGGAGSRQGAQRKTLPSETEARLRAAARLQCLQSVLQDGGANHAEPRPKQVYTYLLENQGAVRPREQLQAFAAAAKALGLSRAEALQLLNLRPTTLVELHLVIANCEARLAPERLDELLALVAQHLRS